MKKNVLILSLLVFFAVGMVAQDTTKDKKEKKKKEQRAECKDKEDACCKEKKECDKSDKKACEAKANAEKKGCCATSKS